LPGDSVVLYDGVCVLCNRTVRRLLFVDWGKRLRFAPLQGPTAAAVRARHAQEEWADSLIFVQDFEGPGEKLYWRSEAVFRALTLAAGLGPLAGLLRLFPRALQDKVYDLVARRRYAWFGKHAGVLPPPAGTEDRFLP
jgi:predicted DCC family thiol-disulfide oxidoreductase YuxK